MSLSTISKLRLSCKYKTFNYFEYLTDDYLIHIFKLRLLGNFSLQKPKAKVDARLAFSLSITRRCLSSRRRDGGAESPD